MTSPLLSVRDLTISLPAVGRRLYPVRGISFDLYAGEVLGLAGESGSGKSITAAALLGLLPAGGAMGGTILFDGRELTRNRPKDWQSLRGRDIAMIFQDPATALHPMLSVGRQFTEHLRAHLRHDKATARKRAYELFDMVRIPDAKTAYDRFPHEFSGGMRQRIAIAIALACAPRILLADEPTTALDVTVQAGILQLLDDLRRDLGLAVLLITHDMGVMSALTNRVAVMYAGRIIETGPCPAVMTSPRHPYTQGLLHALPRDTAEGILLQPMKGTPPTIGELPAGCPFAPRCPEAQGVCHTHEPALCGPASHTAACVLTKNEEAA